MKYNYEYFCGANVLVEVNSVTSLEVAGLAYSLSESRRPIYGYSSRHFDAMARGRVLVQGTILVNYVDHDYFWRVIQLGFGRDSLIGDIEAANVLGEVFDDEAGLYDLVRGPRRDAVSRELAKNYSDNIALAEAFKRAYWGDPLRLDPKENSATTFNPNDLGNEIDIKVTFGDKDEKSPLYGSTGYFIKSVYFTGRGQQIQISEDVIVEEIPFIARDVHSFVGRYNNTPQVRLDIP